MTVVERFDTIFSRLRLMNTCFYEKISGTCLLFLVFTIVRLRVKLLGRRQTDCVVVVVGGLSILEAA